MLLAVNQVAGIERRQLKSVPVSDRVGRTSFDAVSAKDAAVVIDVVNLGVALCAANAISSGVFGGLDVNAIGWARSRAQKAGYTFLQAVFVAL